jgi:predicted tellurium resistance membrane protein TerC
VISPSAPFFVFAVLVFGWIVFVLVGVAKHPETIVRDVLAVLIFAWIGFNLVGIAEHPKILPSLLPYVFR